MVIPGRGWSIGRCIHHPGRRGLSSAESLLTGGVDGWRLPTSFPNTNLRLGRPALAGGERTYASAVNKDKRIYAGRRAEGLCRVLKRIEGKTTGEIEGLYILH